MQEYLTANWFSLAQSIGIIATLLLTLTMLRRQMHQTRVANALLVTQHHREIWTLSIQNPCLRRVFDPEADILTTPITEEERTFVYLILLHMSATLKAVQAQAIYPIEGMERDLIDVMSHPIPYSVWLEVRQYHDRAFVEFVSSHVPDREVQIAKSTHPGDLTLPRTVDESGSNGQSEAKRRSSRRKSTLTSSGVDDSEVKSDKGIKLPH
jgi:hypothetical protein